MSADPIVQAPGFTQSFNRYSYTFNNPLSYTDPSGFEIERPNVKCISDCLKRTPVSPNLGMSIRTFWSEPTPREPLPRPNPAPATSRPVQPDGTQERPGNTVDGMVTGAAFEFQRAFLAQIVDFGDAAGNQFDALQGYLDYGSLTLDATVIGSPFSWIPDVANSSISALRGDYAGAGLSAAAAVPGFGAAGNLTRIGIREAHHVIPRFLGGLDPQRTAHLTVEAHRGFHQILRARLKEQGIDLPIGGRGGSTAAWEAYFRANPGSQAKAFTAVLEASRLTDQAFGSSLVRDFWLNIANGTFRSVP